MPEITSSEKNEIEKSCEVWKNLTKMNVCAFERERVRERERELGVRVRE